MPSKERNSAVEWLRIASMFLVVLLHFNVQGINPKLFSFGGDPSLENMIGHLVESIAIVAVDVFVLISGYFGIRFKLRGVLRLFLMCLCWGVIAYLLLCICEPRPIGKSLFTRLFAFTRDRWWFIIAYLYLYFAAPLLNTAVDHLKKREFILILILFSVSNLYFGYVRKVGDNQGGYAFSQFVYLYLIGRFINKYVPVEQSGHTRKKLAWWWLLFTGLTFSLALLNQTWLHGKIAFLRPYPYNGPFVIGAAVCLLCYALTFSFTNRTVNRVAGAVLPAYLLQESASWGQQWLYPASSLFLGAHATGEKYLLLLLMSFVFLAFAILVDLVLHRLVYNPVLSVYERKVMPKEEIAYERISGFLDRLFCKQSD